jgi:hypothetical protein
VRGLLVRPGLVFILLAALLGACSPGNQPGSVAWRNVTIQLPDGWYVFEEADTRLSISNEDIGPEALRGGVPEFDQPVVAMFFTYEPNTLPDDWRRYVDQQDATLESDDQIVLEGEVPRHAPDLQLRDRWRPVARDGGGDPLTLDRGARATRTGRRRDRRAGGVPAVRRDLPRGSRERRFGAPLLN